MDRPAGGVTVVIPTFRRPASLRRALDSLAAQDDPGMPWRVLVVDNDRERSAAAAVAAACDSLAVAVELEVEPEPGAASARNRGIDVATTELVAFLDDDVVADRAWLRSLLGPVLAGVSTGAAGRVELDWRTDRPPWLAESLDGYLAWFAPSATPRLLRPDEYLLSANAAFDTARLRAIGGFDPVLGPQPGRPAGNDDTDLFRRYLGAGGTVQYVPDAVVEHELPAARLRPGYLLARTYGQGRSDWLLDRQLHRRARLRGIGHAGRLLGHELAHRARERPWHRDVAFRAACDVARAAGFLAQAVASEQQRPVAD